MQLVKPGFIPDKELFRFNPQTQDKGFAQMLSEVAATQAQAASQPQNMLPVERELVQQLQIPDYGQIFEQPEAVMSRTAQAFERFNERARQVAAELQRYDIAHLIHIRLGVGGVTTGARSDFSLDNAFLGQLWRTEGDISDWSNRNHRLMDAISGLGVSHALAKAVYHLQSSEGLNRKQAFSAGVLGSYINRVLDDSFNLNGANPLSRDGLISSGFSAQAFLSARSSGTLNLQHYDLRAMTAMDLRGNALGLFRMGQLSQQAYSTLWHLSTQERSGQPQDWLTRLDETLGSNAVFGPVADALAEIKQHLQRLQDGDR